MTKLITTEDIACAARALHGVAIRTPLLPAPELGERVWVKPESLQRGGAFKLRGAYNFVAALPEEARARGVIAPSSGNHAQAVAIAAKLFSIPATVVMPETVTRAKRAGAERLGARIELAGTTTQHRMARAREIAEREGMTLVPPYDHPMIIAGQGTVGLEIASDLPEVGTVLVPVGGGGLSSGVATAVKRLCPRAKVIGVEPEGAPKLTRAFQAGEPVLLEKTESIADGLLAIRVGTIPFAHHRVYLERVVTVPDAAIRSAVRTLFDRMKLVVEPSGAITAAALLTGIVAPEGPTVAVLSGGNVESEDMASLLT